MGKKPIVLITGGSSGLGKCLAEKFLQYQMDICLVARKKHILENVQEEFKIRYPASNIFILNGNISNEAFVKQIYCFLESKNYYPSYLINCAGIGRFGSAEATSKKIIHDVFEANLVGLMLMCSEALSYMKSNTCCIINIMSTAALRGKANETVYCAAKWGARGYTEALKEAVKNTNIHVIGVYPGGMNTNFWSKQHYDETKLKKFMNADEVAQKIFEEIFINKIQEDIIIERKKQSV